MRLPAVAAFFARSLLVVAFHGHSITGAHTVGVMITSYGLFWRADEIEWSPGRSSRGFRLLGRRGVNRPGLEVADFRKQRGLYVLYGNYGPYYVGLTQKQDLGRRLKQHLNDHHRGRWDRFSWFGFRRVLKTAERDGTRRLAELAEVSIGSPQKMIKDMEALLIKALGCESNLNKMNFTRALEWQQVKAHETDAYLAKVARRIPARR